MFIVFGVIWLVLSILVGAAAQQRDRNPFGWLLLALFISPLLAAIFLLLFQRDTSEVDDREIRRAIKAGRRRR